VIRAVTNVFFSAYGLAEAEQQEDIYKHLERKNVIVVKLKMEMINGWWYGFYTPPHGTGETFVAQGPTYDEAIANCKERLSTDKHTFKIEFEKNETKSIQN